MPVRHPLVRSATDTYLCAEWANVMRERSTETQVIAFNIAVLERRRNVCAPSTTRHLPYIRYQLGRSRKASDVVLTLLESSAASFSRTWRRVLRQELIETR